MMDRCENYEVAKRCIYSTVAVIGVAFVIRSALEALGFNVSFAASLIPPVAFAAAVVGAAVAALYISGVIIFAIFTLLVLGKY